jgi:hypothetical protein
MLYAEAQVVSSCTYTPTLDDDNDSWPDSNARETDLFYAIGNARTWTLANVWNHLGGDRSRTIYPKINFVSSGCATNECYVTTTGEMRLETGSTHDLYIILHEYGHHVHWTFNDISTACQNTYNHQLVIVEAFAGVFARLMGAEYNSGVDYHVTWDEGSPYSVFSRHTDITFGAEFDPVWINNCTRPHAAGIGVIAAAWEAAWDVDCTDPQVDCDNTSSIHSANSVGWSPYTGREAIVRGMAYSLDVGTTGDRDMDNFILYMLDYIEDQHGSSIHNAVESIFNHHNLGP